MKIRHFDELPKVYTAYPKVLKGLLGKSKSKDKTLPQVTYVVDELHIDTDHLAKYNAICGYKETGTVPATYLTVLSQSLQVHLMTSEPFPFALLGLVHIRNSVTQYRPIATSEVLALSCQLGELKPHDKGVQFDFIITAKAAGEVVFEGLTTYLARQKTEKKDKAKDKQAESIQYQLVETWSVAEDIGRRYALISGDFNFIHIHALSAKLFGFPSAIAHGLWSKARALAALDLPKAYTADVAFKLPMYLPSTVELLSAKAGKDTLFLVRNSKSHKPHLSGEVKAL